VMFGDGLAAGKHTLALKISEEKEKNSSGNAMRAMWFCVNDGAK
jgi:hypothetical protein